MKHIYDNKIYEVDEKGFCFIDSNFNEKFKNEIINILKEKKIVHENFEDLVHLHQNIIDKDLLFVNPETGFNKCTIALYETSEYFNTLYLEFLKDLYHKLNFDFYFQSTPNIRVNCPHENADLWFPFYHSDCFLGHPPQEINIWLSLTKNKNSGFYLIDRKNSDEWFSEVNNDPELFINKIKNDRNFKYKGNNLGFEIESHDDKILLFDSLCIHTNQARQDDCRISIDVRINPVENFVDGYVGSGRMKAEFKPGGKMGYELHPISKYI